MHGQVSGLGQAFQPLKHQLDAPSPMVISRSPRVSSSLGNGVLHRRLSLIALIQRTAKLTNENRQFCSGPFSLPVSSAMEHWSATRVRSTDPYMVSTVAVLPAPFCPSVRPTHRHFAILIALAAVTSITPAPASEQKQHQQNNQYGFHRCTSLVRGSRTGLYNGRLTSSLCSMIKVAKMGVWSHSTTLGPDSHGAACDAVSEFAL